MIQNTDYSLVKFQSQVDLPHKETGHTIFPNYMTRSTKAFVIVIGAFLQSPQLANYLHILLNHPASRQVLLK